MGKRERAIRLWRRQQGTKQPTILRNRGILGNGSGTVAVPNRPDLVFVRVNADPKKIWKVERGLIESDINNLPVIIQKDPDNPLWRIVEIHRAMLAQIGIGFGDLKLKAGHHLEHEWPDQNPAHDAINIYRRSLFDLRTEATASYSMNVNVRPIRYTYGGEWQEFLGDTAYLASYVPGAGISRVTTYLDIRDNSLKAVAGQAISYTSTAKPQPPILPWYAKPSAFVRLHQGQAVVTEGDIEDARDVMGHGGINHALQQERDPTATDDMSRGFSEGSLWINRTYGQVFICIGSTLGAADWQTLVTGEEPPDPSREVSRFHLMQPVASLSTEAVITLEQKDRSQPFFRVFGESVPTAPSPTSYNLVPMANVATYTPIGFFGIYVEDENEGSEGGGDGITDFSYWVPFYELS